ncbi:phage baseplate plug family protein [Bacillus badius]|uniref:Cyanophage baseplate Pam3 plug gp18 domain-containing protein n=1 Tax=Bacillus badius TaxID=1455 RepID=A0ABR5ANQ9_BACBA|nr:hypothetical protein [Bacillus badius]KIL72518.1 hypothetical protein SD77_3491 [Bacillus badius]MED4718297.1 hypothetical protein [Bacillus badius]
MIYIPIEKELLPEEFEIQLGAEFFIMGINYNESFDFFTVDLYDNDRNPIVLGEKMVIDLPLWEGISDNRLPAPTLIPYDTSGKAERITFESLMVTTFLIIDSEADDYGDSTYNV